jgi:hypothetical protein
MGSVVAFVRNDLWRRHRSGRRAPGADVVKPDPLGPDHVVVRDELLPHPLQWSTLLVAKMSACCVWYRECCRHRKQLAETFRPSQNVVLYRIDRDIVF